MFDFLTPQIFDFLVVAALVLGLVLAAIRLRSDLARGAPRMPKPVDWEKSIASGVIQPVEDNRIAPMMEREAEEDPRHD
jgi:hypothetical protein